MPFSSEISYKLVIFSFLSKNRKTCSFIHLSPLYQYYIAKTDTLSEKTIPFILNYTIKRQLF